MHLLGHYIRILNGLEDCLNKQNFADYEHDRTVGYEITNKS